MVLSTRATVAATAMIRKGSVVTWVKVPRKARDCKTGKERALHSVSHLTLLVGIRAIGGSLAASRTETGRGTVIGRHRHRRTKPRLLCFRVRYVTTVRRRAMDTNASTRPSTASTQVA